jgi:DNA-binding PadR family transcriptional regulator
MRCHAAEKAPVQKPGFSKKPGFFWAKPGFFRARLCFGQAQDAARQEGGCMARRGRLLSRNSTSEGDMTNDDPITRHFFNGFIRLHVLYHAAKEPTCGAEITAELVRHGYRISQGTLYPTLHLLEQYGYLRSYPDVVRGKRRRYYRATSAGRRVLSEAREKLAELVGEVIHDHDQPFQALKKQRRELGDGAPAPARRKRRRTTRHTDRGPR